jgi:dTDP-4-amino-4,6-dideoxygalactose transaminase
MINVTKVHLPPLEEYVKHLQGIWARGHLTNNGPLVIELERGLREYLGVPHVFLVSNGMLALHIAFKALQLKGKVVTTPFSYVATTASLAWEGLQPIFADLDERLCIGAAAIESVWSEDVCAILATHVYGNACDVESIQALAKRKNVPVIYDAAHSFGARYQGRSLVSYGDIATLSFHATKLFHTGEGGAVITHDPALAKRIEYLRNFGHASPETFHDFGTNAKVSELHAAMGLCILPKVDQLIAARKSLVEKYDSELKGLGLTQPVYSTGLERNYAYYPVLFKSETDLLKVRSVLNTENIYPRRYFYPSLSSLNYVSPQATPICDDIASRVLCLPLWPELDPMQVTRITALIRKALN